MNAETFARAVAERLRSDGAQTALEGRRWRLFLDMLRACRDYVPAAAMFDDWHLEYHEDNLRSTLKWGATVTPALEARLLTPSAVTLRRTRWALASVHLRRLLWVTLEAILDRPGARSDEAALARLIILADLFPNEYRRFDIHIRSDYWSRSSSEGGVSYAPAATSKAYLAYSAAVHVPGRVQQVMVGDVMHFHYAFDPTPPQTERQRVAPLMEGAADALRAPVSACFEAAGMLLQDDGESA